MVVAAVAATLAACRHAQHLPFMFKLVLVLDALEGRPYFLFLAGASLLPS